jgi:hypothetical protein
VELAPPNLTLTDDEFVICGRDRLRDLRGLTKPVEESVDHDVRQNWVGVGTLKEFGMDDAEGLDSGTCD